MPSELEVGARHGLMPWGRERLAESWYDMAVTEMAKAHPNRGLALWHLNCAIHLNPMFSEAMELRAQVTGKEMTATNDSAIRSFVRKQVMNDRAYPTTEPAPSAVVSIDSPAPAQETAAARPPSPHTALAPANCRNSPVSASSTPAITDRACTSRPTQLPSTIPAPPVIAALPPRQPRRQPAPTYERGAGLSIRSRGLM